MDLSRDKLDLDDNSSNGYCPRDISNWLLLKYNNATL